MNIGRGIYNLLKRQSDVYVKGLGSFRRQHTQAAYDEERQVYHPPINHIVFDGASEAGYDFVRYVQALELIDRSEADHLVTEAVAELQQRIEDEGRAKLDDLGYLVKYGDSHVFKAFDLSGFNYRPTDVPVETDTAAAMGELSVEVERAVVEEERAEREKREKRESAPAEAAMPEFVPETEEREDGERQSGTLWYVVSAVLILGIIAALAWYMLVYQKTTRPVAPVEATPTEPQAVDTPEQRTAPPDTASVRLDSLAAAPASGSAETAEEPVLVPDGHAWQIVIGSFQTMEEANSHAETYHKTGHANVKAIPSKVAHNRKKVIWDSYATKAEADSALRYVKANITKDAWPDRVR